MAINAKITFIFNSAKNGWSESWYMTNVADLTTAIANAQSVVVPRLGLCGANVSMEAMRVINADSPRQGKLVDQSTQFNKTTYQQQADNPWNCLLVGATAAAYRRSMYLRGSPDAWYGRPDIAGGGVPISYTLCDKNLGILFTAMQGAGFCLRVKSKEAANPAVVVTAWSILNGIITLTAAGLNTVKGQYYQVSGQRSYGLNGIYQAAVTQADALSFNTNLVAFPTIYTGGLQVRPVVTLYVPVDGLTRERQTERKTGRAFFVTRGRSRRHK